MEKFYAVGTQLRKNRATGEVETVTVLMKGLPDDRLGAVQEAELRAKRNKIQLQGVYPFRNVR